MEFSYEKFLTTAFGGSFKGDFEHEKDEYKEAILHRFREERLG
jgi:hypothetical protein